MPLAVFFPAPLPQTLRPAAQYVNALPVQEQSARYLDVQVREQSAVIAADRLSAQVSAQLALLAGVQARQTRVVLAAYAADGSLVGMRSWESSTAWQDGLLPVNISVYSLGERIQRVEMMAEARP